MKRGIQQSLGDFNYLRQYLNWHDIMVLIESNKLKHYDSESGIELFKEKTAYIDCKKSDEVVVNFWKIFTDLNYEDKKGYLNFVSGKSRIADVAHRWT